MRILMMVPALTLLTALAQEPPHGGPMPEPKNLKVLKVPAAQLMPIMGAFSAGLGVKCDFCHVKGDFASDENPHKEIARKMILMSHEINANFPDGKMHVTCYTCHRGETEPKTSPGAAGSMHEEHEHKQ
jgi:photosynthetic reaction center cytochrome c subunit